MLYTFKLLAGAHEEVFPGSKTEETPQGELRKYKAGAVIVSEINLAERFGREKFLFVGNTNDPNLPNDPGALSKDDHIKLLEDQLRALKSPGNFDNQQSQSLADKETSPNDLNIEPTRLKLAESSYGKLEELTVAELREVANEYRVDLHGSGTKAEIIAKIREELNK